nr:MAG TPA: hypothetical protein [Caudoviricetes sp.]
MLINILILKFVFAGMAQLEPILVQRMLTGI